MAIKEFEINLTRLDTVQSVKEFVEEEIKNGQIKITKDIWRSKYNKYVVFDYQPFCTEGFEHFLYVEGEENYMIFFYELFKDKTSKYLTLEKLYNISNKNTNKTFSL